MVLIFLPFSANFTLANKAGGALEQSGLRKKSVFVWDSFPWIIDSCCSNCIEPPFSWVNQPLVSSADAIQTACPCLILKKYHTSFPFLIYCFGWGWGGTVDQVAVIGKFTENKNRAGFLWLWGVKGNMINVHFMENQTFPELTNWYCIVLDHTDHYVVTWPSPWLEIKIVIAEQFHTLAILL